MTTIGLPSTTSEPRTGARRPGQTATDRTDVQLPVLDPRILDDLGTELSSQACAVRFAELFGEMLPQRIRSVEDALAARDEDAAVVALLSLKASASMVGALRLVEASSSALELLDEPSAHPALALRLQRLGTEFQSALGGIIR
ncbi:hypothetical protein [Arthrobacter sedimenti]|uniref:hypothetical protein n=1 Tax=Arthrobacter sedimenti TaxID=2694931 RepID=UPI000B352B5C|nr:hypothetical protein [Arthrobacter sedimenti]OUM44884.1 hypothetical protein B8W73_01830 [Arthrobacter agilis]